MNNILVISVSLLSCSLFASNEVLLSKMAALDEKNFGNLEKSFIFPVIDTSFVSDENSPLTLILSNTTRAYKELRSQGMNDADASTLILQEAQKQATALPSYLQDELPLLLKERLSQINSNQKIISRGKEVILGQELKSFLQGEQRKDDSLAEASSSVELMLKRPLLQDSDHPKSIGSAETKYLTKEELVKALFEDTSTLLRSPTSQVATTSLYLQSVNFKEQLSVEYMGVQLQLGPEISFKKQTSSRAMVTAEGLTPPVNESGVISFAMTDKNGKPIIKNGIPWKRKVSLICQSSTIVESNYSGSASVTFAGFGGGTQALKSFKKEITLQSAAVALPESIDQQEISLTLLSNLCHNEFLNTPTSNGKTVTENIAILASNVSRGLRFNHPNTVCASDEQCKAWHVANAGVALSKTNSHCLENIDEPGSFICQMRGKVGASCPVYDSKLRTRVSSGINEAPCEPDLECALVRPHGLFREAQGICRNKFIYNQLPQ